ncbi:cytochrome P450 [Coniella lustricola]|uniref:Cytochrome P450 n=1 Tax=Coniella lustricola TaxID=2025994 RepID=A0A2T3A621_9PEZI|nr:cytochrome P450 [Coniella lustricola]
MCISHVGLSVCRGPEANPLSKSHASTESYHPLPLRGSHEPALRFIFGPRPPLPQQSVHHSFATSQTPQSRPANKMDRLIQHIPADSAWTTLVFQFGLLGIAVHPYMRLVEVDSKATTYFLSYVFVPLAIVLDLHFYGGLSVSASLLRTFVVVSSFSAGLFASILVYRLFFHRLRRFPGPFGAKVSKIWAFVGCLKRHTSYLDVAELHDKYGDFVRVGPREMSILRASAVNAIYGPSSKCIRGTHYNNPSDDSRQNSLVATRDIEMHRHRKRAWDRGLGKRALDMYEPRVQAITDLLMTRLAEQESESTVDIIRLFNFFGFDVMGDIGFSQDFGLLKSNQEHPAVEGIREQSLVIGTMQKLPWLFSPLVQVIEILGNFGLKMSFQLFLDWCSHELEVRRQAIKLENETGRSQDPQDIISWLIKAENEKDNSAPPSKKAFQEDSRVMVVAGSDTTSVTLGNAFYFLAKHPQIYHKLQQALDIAVPDGEAGWSYAKIKDIPLLDHIILETLRLRPAVLDGLPRVTPPEGIQIDEVFIPGDVNVSVPTWRVQRDTRYWGDDATAFRPERWEAISSQDSVPFLPFTRGRYTCAGKALSMMEMRMVISKLAMRYNVAFAKGDKETAEKWEAKAVDSFIMTVPPLPLVFTRR